MNKLIKKKVGNNIRRIRKSIGMTQDTLAAKLQLKGCDITRSAIAKSRLDNAICIPIK